jgi:ABC-type nitrate/sulfonate/bicarbonate transport system ATPase subunit
LTNPILRTAGLGKSFLLAGKPKPILKDVEFSMLKGQFVSIVGSSGCGKSTFLELLAGITRPDLGRIEFQGREITGISGLLGYMPQDDLLFPWLSLTENLLLPARVKNSNLKAAREKIAQLLPVFGLREHAGHLPYQLSGGLRQRAALLRTCMTEAELLLLDEPFASLDAITRSQLQLWLKDITLRLGLSIILVTHDIEEAICLSDEILVMRGAPGSFVASFAVDAGLREDQPRRAGLKADILSLIEQR